MAYKIKRRAARQRPVRSQSSDGGTTLITIPLAGADPDQPCSCPICAALGIQDQVQGADGAIITQMTAEECLIVQALMMSMPGSGGLPN